MEKMKKKKGEREKQNNTSTNYQRNGKSSE
jgi:hypothetical protein